MTSEFHRRRAGAGSQFHRASSIAVRVGIGTAISAGGAGLTAAAAIGLFRIQGGMARRAMGDALDLEPPNADGIYQAHLGSPARLLLLGDSIAAGLGAQGPDDTPGARLASKIAMMTGRSVELRTAAVVGSQSADLGRQLAGLPRDYAADVAVIIVGGNDVAHLVVAATAARALREVVVQLQARGAQVVVGTCPDLGVIPAIPQPLRSIAGFYARRLACLQERAVLDVGAISVALGKATRPLFRANPDTMFAGDRFHPSSLGYERSVAALLPAVAKVLATGAGG